MTKVIAGIQVSDDVVALNPELVSSQVAQNPSKYKNARTEMQGMTFQSGREAAAIGALVLLEKNQRIFALRLQVRIPLPGKITYVADAIYCELRDGKLMVVVADAKGYKTGEYKLKKRLFREYYGMEITEL